MATSLQALDPFTDPQINMPHSDWRTFFLCCRRVFPRNLARKAKNQSLNNYAKPAKYKESQSTSRIQAKARAILTKDQKKGRISRRFRLLCAHAGSKLLSDTCLVLVTLAYATTISISESILILLLRLINVTVHMSQSWSNQQSGCDGSCDEC
jgi:hypothetical protein